MKKTKKIIRTKKSTRKYGGKKNNTSLVITQLGGEATAANPSISYSLDYPSVVASLTNFGNTILKFVDDTASDLVNAKAHKVVSQSDTTTAAELDAAATALSNAYLGPDGLYKKLLPNGPYYVSPLTPAPAPIHSGGNVGGNVAL